MNNKPPVVALVVYPNFSPFHFAVPYLVFSARTAEGPLFDLKIVSSGGRQLAAERALTLQPDGGLELADGADILVVPGWDELDARPAPDLVEAMARAHARGAHVVGLCYGAYALAYAGLLDGRRASTHWMAEKDFGKRFPRIRLDMNALYVDEDKLITSAGTGAGLDCCLYLVREYYGARIAKKVARTLAAPTQDAQLNRLLDHLRANLDQAYSIDELAARTAMSRRTFTRHFSKATGMTVVDWLVNERLQRSRDLLETTALSVD